MTVNAQDYSAFRVKYMVTHDASKNLFTAWVVPKYNTPNYNNGDSEEKGATAQFTIKVPLNFTISQIQDIKGNWGKNPLKIGEQKLIPTNIRQNKSGQVNANGLEFGYAYYVLGKAPAETNYGQFQEGEPVALFSFKGKGGNPADVSAMESHDPFVIIADETMSLNVGSSFYSRSGQKPSVTAKPLEQFAEPTTLQVVLDKATRKAATNSVYSAEIGSDSKVIAYPNIATEVIMVKYFSEQEGSNLNLDVINLVGNSEISQKVTTTLGFNLIKINVSTLQSGSYIIKSVQGNKISTNKFTKIEQ
jgi:hypothetical protein